MAELQSTNISICDIDDDIQIITGNLRLFVGFPLSVLGIVLNSLLFIGFTRNKNKNINTLSYQVYFIMSCIGNLLDAVNYFKLGRYCTSSGTVPVLVHMYYFLIFAFYLNGLLDSCLFLKQKMKLVINRLDCFSKFPVPLIALMTLGLASSIAIPNIFYINVESHNINPSLNLTYTQVNFSQFYKGINGKLLFYIQYSITISIILIQHGLITRFTFPFRTRFNNTINNLIALTPSSNAYSQQAAKISSRNKFLLIFLTFIYTVPSNVIYLILNVRNIFDSYTFFLLTCFNFLETFKSYLTVVFFYVIDEDFKQVLKTYL